MVVGVMVSSHRLVVFSYQPETPPKGMIVLVPPLHLARDHSLSFLLDSSPDGSTSLSSCFLYRSHTSFPLAAVESRALSKCSRVQKARCLNKTLEHLSGQRKPLASHCRKSQKGPSHLPSNEHLHFTEEDLKAQRC